MWNYYVEAMKYVNGMTRDHWLIAFAVVVAWGAFCMRGFGSRSKY